MVDELDLSIAPSLVGGEKRLLEAALPAAQRLDLRQLLEEAGTLFRRYASAVAGRRPVPIPCALRSASSVSSTLRRTVVSMELSAPPLPIASATAAIDTSRAPPTG